MNFVSVSNGAMNILNTGFSYPHATIFSSTPFHWLPNSQSNNKEALNFERLSHDGGRANFSENLRASLFIDELYRMNLLSARSFSLGSIFKLMYIRQ
jgi:hypothetical protein